MAAAVVLLVACILRILPVTHAWPDGSVSYSWAWEEYCDGQGGET